LNPVATFGSSLEDLDGLDIRPLRSGQEWFRHPWSKGPIKRVTVAWSSWGLEGTDENLANN